MSMTRRGLLEVVTEEGLLDTKPKIQNTPPVIHNTQYVSQNANDNVHNPQPAPHITHYTTQTIDPRATIQQYRRRKSPLNCTIPFSTMDLLEEEYNHRQSYDTKCTKSDIVAEALQYYITELQKGRVK